MKYYYSYMDRQCVSPEFHQKLLALADAPARRPSPRPWLQFGTLAACCALVLGLGIWKLSPSSSGGPNPGMIPASSSQGEQSPDNSAAGDIAQDSSNPYRFVADSGVDIDKMMMPMIPAIQYGGRGGESAASIALPEGSFTVDLTQEDISILLWGSRDRMEAAHFKEQGEGNVPWLLFWDGYTLSGQAWYDGEGNLWQAVIQGTLDESHEFTLSLAPGRLPPTCTVNGGAAVTVVDGVEVSAWKAYYDRNGDGIKEYVYESAFVAHDIGVRFQSVTLEDSHLSDLLIRWATWAPGLSLEHLLTNENIPAWREEAFASLSAARQEEAFAPYLPQEEPAGYSEFYGNLSYQEGRQNRLFVRWSRVLGYDDVEVAVNLPEDGWKCSYTPVDVDNPASYDTQLYSVPWCDSVPPEYQGDFYSPTFRAEDMSLSVVEARNTEKDTGGSSYHFRVLHSDGTLVSYSCDGLTARQVWALVEPTLAAGAAAPDGEICSLTAVS